MLSKVFPMSGRNAAHMARLLVVDDEPRIAGSCRARSERMGTWWRRRSAARTRLREAAGPIVRPGHPRPPASRRRRVRGPSEPAVLRTAAPRAGPVRGRRRGGTGAVPARGCGRLPGQAVRGGRAPRAGRCSAGRGDRVPPFRWLEVGTRASRPPETRAWTSKDARTPLSPREFVLLPHLMRRADEVCTRDELLADVWGLCFDPRSNVVDVYVGDCAAKIDRRAHRDGAQCRILLQRLSGGQRWLLPAWLVFATRQLGADVSVAGAETIPSTSCG